jgi:hypothetical protein
MQCRTNGSGKARNTVSELLVEDAVVVHEHESRWILVIEGIPQLLSGPFGGGMIGHIKVDELSSVVREKHQHIEDLKTDSRNCEEIQRNDLSGVIL